MGIFEDALEHTLEMEGGYSHDPKDPGGETYRGISRRYHPDWPGWRLVDSEKPLRWNQTCHNPTVEFLAREFYQREFWEPVRRWGLPDRTTMKLFDTGVNVGISQAVRFLQRAAGATVDGRMGPQTKGAVMGMDEQALLERFAAEQMKHYRRFCNRQGYDLDGFRRRAMWLPA